MANAAKPTIEELRALYERSSRVLTRRKRTAHRTRMAYRAATKRVRQRQAITLRRKLALDKAIGREGEAGRRTRVCRAALADVGIHEAPGHPNADLGGPIDKMNAAVGMSPGPYAYWCGSAVHKWLKAGGLDFPDWIRYVPSILTFAQRVEFGLSVTRTPEKGDLVVMNFDGGVPDHVALYVGGGRTVEGNTSPGTGGSQNNGGGVYARNPRGGVTYVHIDYEKAPQLERGKERH